MSPLRSQTRTRAKSVVDILKSKGYRVSSPRELSNCVTSYLECCDLVFLLAFYDGKFTDDIIVKVTTDVGGCDEVLYTPRGLYIIGGSDEEVAERVLEKARFLSALRGALRG